MLSGFGERQSLSHDGRGLLDSLRDDFSGWIATVQATTYTHTDPEPGDRTYTIRIWMGGPTDVTCDPDPLTV